MLKTVRLSLRDLLGDAYIGAMLDSACFFGLGARAEKAADEKVDFLPAEVIERWDAWLGHVGRPVARGLPGAMAGAPTRSFARAARQEACPLACFGPYRIGESGKLFFAAKSEHYHVPLGHRFPGYRLLENARALGVSNASHNNHRGCITRLLEVELVKQAGGLDAAGAASALASEAPGLMNRVINLETGSLAVEAGLKMMLARFHRLDASFPAPEFHSRVPVFLTLAGDGRGGSANYHGTTVLAQTLRGLWPDLAERAAVSGGWRVEPVAVNDIGDFRRAVERFEQPPFKVAGFIHEIVLMNYSAVLLTRDYLAAAYEICRQAGIPVLVDEIQSCMWCDEMFLFRRYGLKPDFAVIGKGFPGGEYPASKILVSAPYDNLNQFGALVTNGQEELASLACLVTMAYVRANGAHLAGIGAQYQERLGELPREFPAIVRKIEGLGLLEAVSFHTVDDATRFANLLAGRGIDISVQTYKSECPPATLTKMPVISSRKMIDFVVDQMRAVLRGMA